jgi:hypothetical protein
LTTQIDKVPAARLLSFVPISMRFASGPYKSTLRYAPCLVLSSSHNYFLSATALQIEATCIHHVCSGKRCARDIECIYVIPSQTATSPEYDSRIIAKSGDASCFIGYIAIRRDSVNQKQLISKVSRFPMSPEQLCSPPQGMQYRQVCCAMIKRIESRHGGRVWMEGKRHERATLYFYIPTNESRYEEHE